MAKKKILDRSIRKKKLRSEETIKRKIKKIKRENPDVTKDKLKEIEEEERERYNQLKETYEVEYLNPKELIVLDAVLRNRPRQEVMAELGISQSGYYYILRSPEVQKKLQQELQQRYVDMKKSRKAYYVKIAEKGLSILMNRLEKMEEEELKNQSWEKTKDIMDIITKVVNLMQEEDGTKRTNIAMEAQVESHNTNENVNMEVDLADADFRKQFAQLLVDTDNSGGIIK